MRQSETHLHITHRDYSRRISTYSTRLLFAKVANVQPIETLNVKCKTSEAATSETIQKIHTDEKESTIGRREREESSLPRL